MKSHRVEFYLIELLSPFSSPFSYPLIVMSPFSHLLAYEFLLSFTMACWCRSLVDQGHLRAHVGHGVLDDSNWLAPGTK
jgi:hypothetical protein